MLAEFISAGCETSLSEIHKLINSIWNKEEVIITGYHCYQLHTKMLPNIFLSKLSSNNDKIIWIISVFRGKRSITNKIFCICEILKPSRLIKMFK
jgi:hypothetical protein